MQTSPKMQIYNYLSANFRDDEIVRIVTRSFHDSTDGKYKPLETEKKPAIYANVRELKARLKGPESLAQILPSMDPRAGVWIGVNPTTGKNDDSVTEMRNILIECDNITKEDQIRLYREAGLKYKTLVDSGKKSVHAVIEIEPATTKEEYKKAFDTILENLKIYGIHADPQNGNPSRLTRLAGVMREGKEQTLIEFNPAAGKTYTDMEDLLLDFLSNRSSTIKEVESSITYEGSRHLTLVRYVTCVLKKYGPDRIEEAVERIRITNEEQFSPPMDDKEFNQTIKTQIEFCKNNVWNDPNYDTQKNEKFNLIEAGKQCIRELHSCIIDNNVLYIYDEKDGFVSGMKQIKWYIARLFEGSLTPITVKRLYDYMEDNSPKKEEASGEYIQFKNGILNAETKEFKPLTPELFIRNRIPWNYNPDASPVSIIDETLSQWACGDSETEKLMFEWAGYNLLRKVPIHSLMLLIGKRRNGKSAYCDLIREMLDPRNTSSEPMEDVGGDKYSSGPMYGKLANISDENRGTYMPESAQLKQYSAGSYVKVNDKGEKHFTCRTYTKLTFSFNEDFQVDDRSGALKQRLQVLLFDADFSDPAKQDQMLLSKLTQPEAMEYFIRKSIESLYEVLERGKFTRPKKSELWIERQDIINNPVREFFQEVKDGYSFYHYGFLDEEEGKHITTDENFFTEYPAHIVYECYTCWTKDNGLKAQSQTRFGRTIKDELGLERVKKQVNGQRKYFYVHSKP